MLHILLALALAPAPSAPAAQVEPADRNVDTMRVTYVEPMPRNTMYVELNNGSTWRLRPCRLEDSRTCYWDAGTRGNQRGDSFVNIRGTIVYTNRI